MVDCEHYKMSGLGRKQIIYPELDLKNKVLKDRRKSFIELLKLKRPIHRQNLEKAGLSN